MKVIKHVQVLSGLFVEPKVLVHAVKSFLLVMQRQTQTLSAELTNQWTLFAAGLLCSDWLIC